MKTAFKNLIFFMLFLNINTGVLNAEMKVSMSPPTGQMGATFANSGSGFTPNHTVTLMRRMPNGSVQAVARVRTDSSGSFSATWTAKTPGNNFAWWAVDDATGKKSENEVVYGILSAEHAPAPLPQPATPTVPSTPTNINPPPIVTPTPQPPATPPTIEPQSPSKAPQPTQETLQLREKIKFYNEKIHSISKRLLGAVPNPSEINFKLIVDEQVNAWADGRVSTGMMKFLYDHPVGSPDDQLAMVLAHEIAHVKLQHGELYRMLKDSLAEEHATLKERLGTFEFVFHSLSGVPFIESPLVKLFGTVSPIVAESVFRSLTDQLYNDFTRDQESAADFFGLLFASRAGFNIQEGLKFFGHQAENRIHAFWRDHTSTHPSWRTRYETLVKRAEEIALAKNQQIQRSSPTPPGPLYPPSTPEPVSKPFLPPGPKPQPQPPTAKPQPPRPQPPGPTSPLLTLRVNSWAVVTNTYEPGKGFIGLKLRERPGLSAPKKKGGLPEGARVLIASGPEQRDGYTWWYVKSQQYGEGWCAGTWLVPAP